MQKFHYYLLFVDDFSRYSWVYPLHSKNEVTTTFIQFKLMVERQFQQPIKILRTDRGGEYINRSLQLFLSTCGIVHQTSCPYTPQQNSVVERKHRHLLETVRALHFQANLPSKFWVETLFASVYLINRLPSPINNSISPYQCLYNQSPDYSHLKTFGCLYYPWIPPKLTNKLAPRSTPCLFLGYVTHTKGYKCLDLSIGRLYISHRVHFHENIFPYISTINPNQYTLEASSTNSYTLVPASTINPGLTNNSITSTNTTPPNTTAPHSPNQPTTSLTNNDPTLTSNVSHISPDSAFVPYQEFPTLPKHHMLTRAQTGHLKPKIIFDLQNSIIPTEPSSYTIASKFPVWRATMSVEFKALQKQGTLELVPSHPQQNVLGCKWLFKTKYNSD
ncbi:hypothetical protein KFK09_008119 [Dendrobium nobile]|uniref:Integrase catalytic domain-containing protein n=1 Tax=Dendrobium nobile TaxID=94219 RepID=A0A8T3BYE5_DENNO|nr:hypothetical protein KFK09_008119 [Dendrobium nobile]